MTDPTPLSLADLDNGRAVRAFDAALADGVQALRDHFTGERPLTKGAVKITLTVEVKEHPEEPGAYIVTHGSHLAIPKAKPRRIRAVDVSGVLVEDSPEQMRLVGGDR